MRIANVGGAAHLMIDDSTAVAVREVTGGVFDGSIRQVYDRFEEFVALVRNADLLSPTPVTVSPENLGCAVPEPRQVLAVGMNYAKHIAEFGRTQQALPAIFTKFPSCLNRPYGDVPLDGEFMDFEVELVVVVGRRASNVDVADALSYVAGYTVGQDITDRVLQHAASGQFTLGKSRRGSGPIGPWVVTSDEFGDPAGHRLTTVINGETLQDGTTADMIHPVAELVSLLSGVTDLLPGDLIFTGTPEGVGFGRDPKRPLRNGDVLESTIEGIGSLRNHCVGSSRD